MSLEDIPIVFMRLAQYTLRYCHTVKRFTVVSFARIPLQYDSQVLMHSNLPVPFLISIEPTMKFKHIIFASISFSI